MRQRQWLGRCRPLRVAHKIFSEAVPMKNQPIYREPRAPIFSGASEQKQRSSKIGCGGPTRYLDFRVRYTCKQCLDYLEHWQEEPTENLDTDQSQTVPQV